MAVQASYTATERTEITKANELCLDVLVKPTPKSRLENEIYTSAIPSRKVKTPKFTFFPLLGQALSPIGFAPQKYFSVPSVASAFGAAKGRCFDAKAAKLQSVQAVCSGLLTSA